MIFEEAIVVSRPFDDVLADVKEAFAAEGFGTITEIDMQATLKSKLGKEMGRYVIVGTCNPTLAGRALDVVPEIGVLLPCNVVVREIGDSVSIEAMDPGLMAGISGVDDIAAIADDARVAVNGALARITT
jgi:uncharacterized protein (DUF302 family)